MREAAVSLLIRPRDQLEILLIKRALHDTDPWSGHVALPGGRRDDTDADLLETAVREKIPVVCVVFNDQGLGNERAFQNELYGGRTFAVDYGDVDFAALARVLGAHGERVHAHA